MALISATTLSYPVRSYITHMRTVTYPAKSRLKIMTPAGLIMQYTVEIPTSSKNEGIDGYTLRAGDALLIVDQNGKLVGLLPD